jgi:YVTN family beta-propeller protein
MHISSAIAINPGITNNIIVFKTKSFHGLNLSYPSNLFYKPHGLSTIGFSLNEFSPEIINIEYIKNTSDIKSEVSFNLENYNDLTKYSNFSLIEAKPVTLAKSNAFLIHFKYQMTNLNISKEEMDAFIELNGNIILFKYVEDKDKYIENLPIVENILNTSTITFKNDSERSIPNFNLKKITGMYIDSETNTLYMTDGSDTVFVVDRSMNNPIKNITVGSRPNDLSFIKDYYLYTVNTGDDSISVIDPDTKKVVKTITLNGQNPVGIDTDQNSNDLLVFVTNYDSNSTSIVSGDDFKNIKTISVGFHPSGISVNPVTNRVYIVNKGSDSISVFDYYHNTGGKIVINTNLTKPIHVEKPQNIAVNSLTNTIYVSTPTLVSVIDGSSNKVIKNIPLNDSFQLTIDEKNNHIFIPGRDSPVLHIIDGKNFRFIKNITLSTIPLGVSIDQKRNISYVSSKQSDKFYMIDTKTLQPLAQTIIKINDSPKTMVNCNGKNYTNNNYLIYDIDSEIKCKIVDDNNGRFKFE